MKVAGKTGTSLAEEGAWTHAWFAGYAPADKPEIVLVVFLEKGYGPSDAAGVARKIFAAYAAAGASRAAARRGREATASSPWRPAAAVDWAETRKSNAIPRPRTRTSARRRSGFPQTVRVRLWYLHPPASSSCRPRRDRRRCASVPPAPRLRSLRWGCGRSSRGFKSTETRQQPPSCISAARIPDEQRGASRRFRPTSRSRCARPRDAC